MLSPDQAMAVISIAYGLIATVAAHTIVLIIRTYRKAPR